MHYYIPVPPWSQLVGAEGVSFFTSGQHVDQLEGYEMGLLRSSVMRMKMTNHTNQIFSLTTLNVGERGKFLVKKKKKRVQERTAHEMPESGEEAEGIMLLEQHLSSGTSWFSSSCSMQPCCRVIPTLP